MPKKVLVALPPGLLEQIDFVASVEHRNRSDLIREAMRRYIDQFKRQQNLVVRNGNNVSLGELITYVPSGRNLESREDSGTREDGQAAEALGGEQMEAVDMASDVEEMVLQS